MKMYNLKFIRKRQQKVIGNEKGPKSRQKSETKPMCLLLGAPQEHHTIQPHNICRVPSLYRLPVCLLNLNESVWIQVIWFCGLCYCAVLNGLISLEALLFSGGIGKRRKFQSGWNIREKNKKNVKKKINRENKAYKDYVDRIKQNNMCIIKACEKWLTYSCSSIGYKKYQFF